MQSRGQISEAACAGARRAGIFRGELEGVWVRGNVECRVWIGYAGIRARGFRTAQFCVGAIFAGDVSDLCVWLGRAKRQVAAVAPARESDRMLWIDGAAIRIESQRNVGARGEKGR